MNICWLAMAMLNLWKPDMMKRSPHSDHGAGPVGLQHGPQISCAAKRRARRRVQGDPGWNPAMPADDVAKGQWWRLFGDPVLTLWKKKSR
jgi:hypothetical protein